MALSENPTSQQLQDLAVQYPDLEVTKQDSLNAGNCESGTDDFLEQFFPGRTAIKVSELVPYIEDYQGIRIVLEYKFRELEHQSEAKTEA